MHSKEISEATHHDWGFRKEVFIYSPETPYGPVEINFYPVASELHDWLLGKGQISVLMKEAEGQKNIYENPFTYSATTLACLTAQVVNDTHAFNANKSVTCGLGLLEVEIKRIRLYSELVISSARVCEAVIKQLLHCTQFHKKDYYKTALGGLLFKECRSCNKDKEKLGHNISLLGSLAHRYSLCLAFDCVLDGLQKLSQERKRVAAHAQAPDISAGSLQESLDLHEQDTAAFLSRFVHILDHLSALEALMLEELGDAMKSSDMDVLYNQRFFSDLAFKYLDKWYQRPA